VKRPPGRPPLDEKAAAPSADVHLTLRAVDYDAVHRLATQRRQSIQDVIRQGVKRLIAEKP
jgi:hypothetical protein